MKSPACGRCLSHRYSHRFLRITPTGKLRIDRTAVRRDAHCDGKYLLRTPDESRTPADIADAYKSLHEAERGWRDLKTTQINLRPVYHHKNERIHAHVQLCWLALLILRVAELGVGEAQHPRRTRPPPPGHPRHQRRPHRPTRRAVAWVKDDPFGVEFAEIEISESRLTASVLPSAACRFPTASTTRS